MLAISLAVHGLIAGMVALSGLHSAPAANTPRTEVTTRLTLIRPSFPLVRPGAVPSTVRRMLAKTQPWYLVPPRRGHWQIVVGEPLGPAQYAPAGVPQPLAARALTQHFVDYFTRSLSALAPGAPESLPVLAPGCTMP